jgi:hypothetical protein
MLLVAVGVFVWCTIIVTAGPTNHPPNATSAQANNTTLSRAIPYAETEYGPIFGFTDGEGDDLVEVGCLVLQATCTPGHHCTLCMLAHCARRGVSGGCCAQPSTMHLPIGHLLVSLRALTLKRFNISHTAHRAQVFHGVPFAAPPEGDLRWSPPRAPDKWILPRPAILTRPVCEWRQPLDQPTPCLSCASQTLSLVAANF